MCVRRSGFTLIEIMLAIGLAGVIAAAALAPLTLTVRSLEDAQARWGARRNARSAADRIYRDLRLALSNPSFKSVRIIHEETLASDADDRLMIWSAAPKYEGKNAGVVVYRVLPEDSFSDAEPGLYRWVVADLPSLRVTSGDVLGAEWDDVPEPMAIDPDDLEAKDGELLLSTARGLRFYVPPKAEGGEWERADYEGGLPEILRAEILLTEGSYVRTERFVNAAQ